jgi:hypothetical protein
LKATAIVRYRVLPQVQVGDAVTLLKLIPAANAVLRNAVATKYATDVYGLPTAEHVLSTKAAV